VIHTRHLHKKDLPAKRTTTMSSSNVQQKENAQPEPTTPRGGGSKMRSLANSAKKTKEKLLSFVQSTPEPVSLFRKTLALFSKKQRSLPPLDTARGSARHIPVGTSDRRARFVCLIFFAVVPHVQIAGVGGPLAC
jgi:hypothetical protein